jgi:hypothetical protein
MSEAPMTRCTVGFFVTLALTLLVAPLAADTQPLGKVPRIGLLAIGFTPSTPNCNGLQTR